MTQGFTDYPDVPSQDNLMLHEASIPSPTYHSVLADTFCCSLRLAKLRVSQPGVVSFDKSHWNANKRKTQMYLYSGSVHIA
jgi:hypothetical protein